MKVRNYTCACVFAAIAISARNVAAAESAEIQQFGFFEQAFTAGGQYANPYGELEAEARIKRPDGSERTLPLFWDGGGAWKLRISPDAGGQWSFTVRSRDPGLNEQTGAFRCIPSQKRGSIQPMKDHPLHFQYQNGAAMWFMGDTAWALFTDNRDEKHDRRAAEEYLRERATQGFNVVHASALSEAGWGNAGGPPFEEIGAERINPAYWQEMDHRVASANQQGLVVGLAIAWGDKRKQEPYAWRKFTSREARQRYARYVAGRYGAYHVYFLVSGEWHGEVHTRPSTEAEMKQEFIEIGNALHDADAHQRMIGIHPMTSHGSVREFNEAKWMDFGDYQQNYDDLHARMLESRRFNKPVVNSEYGYYLRDQNGDGVPDKDNSTSAGVMRHATWDILMAGGYMVTGFGTTYFGGYRDPGPFDLAAAKNDEWERQLGVMKQLFTKFDWWKLEPHDQQITCATPRGKDRKELSRVAPPAVTYWLLAEPGKRYLAYARGVGETLTLKAAAAGATEYEAQLFNPRTGGFEPLKLQSRAGGEFAWTPPDTNDWVLLLTAAAPQKPMKMATGTPARVDQWGRFEAALTNATRYANPYADVTLEVKFTRPDSSTFDFWGFHDGEKIWRFRCLADQLGRWSYRARFSDGAPGREGTFECGPSDVPGLIGAHSENPMWFGFKSGKPVLVRGFHVGDRFFASNWPDAERRQFLDWAGHQRYNLLSLASHLLNRDAPGRGRGWDTPRLWPLEAAEYRRMEATLDELAQRRFLVFPFAGFFGQSSNYPKAPGDQERYLRYTLARLGSYWNILWNVAGPEPNLARRWMADEEVERLGRQIRNLDPYGHLLSVHNRTGDDPYRDSDWTTYGVLQGPKTVDLKRLSRSLLESHHPAKPLLAQETLWTGNINHIRSLRNRDYTDDELRQNAWVIHLSAAALVFADNGGGNSSEGFSGALNPPDAAQPRHDIIRRVWDLAEQFEFHRMKPRPDLVDAGFCLAEPGRQYLLYLPLPGKVNLKTEGGPYRVEWINPRDPSDRRVAGTTRDGRMSSPPEGGDWLAHLSR